MRITYVIEKKINQVREFNKITLKSYSVTREEVIRTHHVRKEPAYKIEIFFGEEKVLFDNVLVFFFAFVKRFKIYRCYLNMKENCFHFYLKLRDIHAIDDIVKEQ